MIEENSPEVALKKLTVISEQAACCLEPESGLYHHLHFRAVLNQELARLDRWERPLSLVLLEMPGLSAADWAAVGRVVRASLRRIDLAARKDNLVAVILPDADALRCRRWLAELTADLARTVGPAAALPAYGRALARPWEGRQAEELMTLAKNSLGHEDLTADGGDDHGLDMTSATAIAADERNLLFDGFRALKN
ncbi:MAG: GGDEF domain-containing protein [Candidatus Adiutrix sp.]|jgi:hypothetical protein|nr:GGDEF domain-containing protein [Candidatus Adiutrix sp.]